MFELMGRWVNKSKVEGVTALEYHLGSIRVARIVSEMKHDNVGDKDHTYKVYIHRVMLPGVGTKDFGFAWTSKEAQRRVEEIVTDWLFEAGFADDTWEDKVPEEIGSFVLPDSYVVIDSIKVAPKSAEIIPLERWRRDGKPKPLPKYGSASATYTQWAGKNADKQPAKLDTFASTTKTPRKQSHSQRAKLTRGM